MIFGKKLRELRDEQGVLQRQLAALLEIDTPMFSKIERGDRRAKREHVIKLAEYLHQDEKEMLTLWLADKVLDAVGDDELSKDAINCTRTYSKVITAKRQFGVNNCKLPFRGKKPFLSSRTGSLALFGHSMFYPCFATNLPSLY